MPISYALYENNLTSDPNDYAAQVQITGSADRAAVVRRMVQQGSTTTSGDIAAVMEDMEKAVEALLLEGYRVNLGVCELYPRLPGVFQGITDSFDGSRHRVEVGAKVGSRIRNVVLQNAKVQKMESTVPTPAPLEFRDLGTGEKDGTLTPGNIGTVNGNRLKYNSAQADEGIFLIPADGSPEIKVDAVQRNQPGQLVFLLPTGLSGDYTLEIRARIYGGTDLRSGRLEATLTA